MVEALPLLRTKLYRPPVQADFIHRSRLVDQLNDHWRQRPLTLVSASAGYGKTTLVSSWLAMIEAPVAWLSLEDTDSDLNVFFDYLIASIRNTIPEACDGTAALLKMPESPAPRVLSSSFINELDQIHQPFILVLDDYHLIHAPEVHDLMTKLLSHPPRSMHLVLIGRSDPPVDLPKLRARGLVTEIRGRDLRFTQQETADFFNKVVEHEIDERVAVILEEKTEGWVTGLRLAALSMRQRGEDESRLVERLSGESRYIWDYLTSEVLTALPPAIYRFLVKTSILERLNGSLCDAVAGLDEPVCDGQAYLEWLHQLNLFTIPLDDTKEWYRYHQLLRENLLRQLGQQLSGDEVTDLHARAATWYAQNGLIDGAIRHSRSAGDFDRVVRLIAADRHNLIDAEQWWRLEQRLSSLPHDIAADDPELQIINAWLLNQKGKWQQELASLARTEALLNQEQLQPEIADPIRGEMHLLQANLLGWSYNGQEVLNHVERALQLLPHEWGYANSSACMIEAFGRLLTGQPEQAQEHLRQALQDPLIADRPSSKSLLLFGLAGLHWLKLEIHDMQAVAQRYLNHGRTHKLPETIAVAQYYLGSIHYQRNELEEAEKYFTAAANTRVPVALNFQIQGVCGLALTYLAQGRFEQAHELLETKHAYLMEIENYRLLELLKAIQAEVNLRQAELTSAHYWAEKYNPDPPIGLQLLYIPQLTWIKVLSRLDNAVSHQKALAALDQLLRVASQAHFDSARMAILPYRALLADLQGETVEALSCLREAIQLAEPGGCFRPFVDVGPGLADLLWRLGEQDVASGFIHQILAAMDHSAHRPGQAGQPSFATSATQPTPPTRMDLTDRELEILALLAERLSNKEIAARLFISSGTVRQHCHRIYRKLDVNGRQQAVAKARLLSILPTD